MKKKSNFVAINIYGWAMNEHLPYDKIKFDRIVKLEDILNTPDDSDTGYFVEVDLKHPDDIKDKSKKIHFVLRTQLVLRIISVNS